MPSFEPRFCVDLFILENLVKIWFKFTHEIEIVKIVKYFHHFYLVNKLECYSTNCTLA